MAKKFQFALQKLMDYKGQVLESQRMVLSEMNAVLHTMTKELEDMVLEHGRRVKEFDGLSRQGMRPAEMLIHSNYLRTLEQAIEQKNRQVALQRKAVDKQTDVVVESKKEVSSIEKLRDKKLEEYNYLATKEQELFIEEFVSNCNATAV